MHNASPMRLLPVVMVAIAVVIVFKLANHFVVEDNQVSPIGTAIAQEPAEAEPPAAAGDADAEAETDADAVAEEETLDPEATGQVADSDGQGTPADTSSEAMQISAAERQVLESLLSRRKMLDERERALQLREKLLEAAEKRVEQRVAELKTIEQRIEKSFGKQEESRKEQLGNLVSMYANMKPKDAARIFDKLDMTVLISVVEQMNNRKMAPILARMDSKVAQRLTVHLAKRAAERAGQ
ncbi:MAG: MotE family protein [Hyphomicrobiales bacterium]